MKTEQKENVRECDQRLVEILAKSHKLILTQGNVPVTVKEVPDLIGDGNLDPRVLEDIQNNRSKNTGNPNEAINLKVDSLDEQKRNELLLYLRSLSDKARKDPTKRRSVDISKGEVEITREIFALEKKELTVWRYEAKGKTELSKPCFVHFHGGGFFHGAPNGDDDFLRYIADQANAVVFDVDYALSPENTYPAAVNDCCEAVKYIAANASSYCIDAQKIVVGGASAGGNLSAVVALKLRDEGVSNIAMQVLINPATMQINAFPNDFIWNRSDYDLSGTASIIQESITDPRENAGLSFMFEAYIGDQDPRSPYVSPSLASDLSGLPKAIVVTAEYDSLREQGEYYGGQLLRAGVPTEIIRYNGLRHEDIGYFGVVPQSVDLANRIVQEVKQL